MLFSFGSGAVWVTPLTDSFGNTIATPTPVRVGIAQEVMIDFSWTSKQLFGTYQFPVAVGRGTAKATGTIKSAQINSAIWNDLVLGQPSNVTSGTISVDYRDVTGVALSGTTLTVTPPNTGTYGYDLGVCDVNGVQLTKVASAPAVGQYSEAAAVYTFASGQAAATPTVYIDYNYTYTLAGAKSLTATNPLLGYVPTFQLDLIVPYQNKNVKFTIFQCVGDKLGITTKLEDFIIPEVSFGMFANGANQIFNYSMNE